MKNLILSFCLSLILLPSAAFADRENCDAVIAEDPPKELVFSAKETLMASEAGLLYYNGTADHSFKTGDDMKNANASIAATACGNIKAIKNIPACIFAVEKVDKKFDREFDSGHKVKISKTTAAGSNTVFRVNQYKKLRDGANVSDSTLSNVICCNVKTYADLKTAIGSLVTVTCPVIKTKTAYVPNGSKVDDMATIKKNVGGDQPTASSQTRKSKPANGETLN